MITFLLEILELLNFSHMTTYTRIFESRNKFFDDVTERKYDIITFISKELYFKKG